MATTREFADYVCEVLGPLGDVSARAMFGGFGVYCGGLMFGLIADDQLYLKVDAETRPEYETRGLKPFKPFADKPTVMSYYPVPEELLEDGDALCDWARAALGAAHRTAKSKRPRRGRAD